MKHAWLGVVAAVLCGSCKSPPPGPPVSRATSTSQASQEPTVSHPRAQRYIDAFERGEDFSPPAEGLTTGGQPDPAAIQLLDQTLRTASPAVTESIVALLVDVGLGTDPLQPKGAEVLRHPEIIAVLARVASRGHVDLGREAASSALRKLVRADDLAPYGDGFTRALELSPSEEAFLLVAKAKPPQAKPVVEHLVAQPEWKKEEAARIAHAALGATHVEDELLERLVDAEQANDAKAVAHALGSLALVGTPRSLVAIAERLRTPLTISIPHAYEKSLRLNVLEALLYNYPDQPELYPNNIITEADYTAAEQFCTKTLGVQYTQPPPPFLTYRGAPIPLMQP